MRVTVDGQAQERQFAVERNATLPGVTDADLEEQFALATRIRDKTSEANEAVIRIRALKEAAAQRSQQSADSGVKAAAGALVKSLATWRKRSTR